MEEIARKQKGGNPLENWELLCCNKYGDPPSFGDKRADAEAWCGVEQVNVTGLAPETIERLRTWLMVDANSSRPEISDFTLTKLLLVPTEISSLKMGHSHNVTRQPMTDADCPQSDIPAKDTNINWREHQLFIATKKTRPVDSFYQPYEV